VSCRGPCAQDIGVTTPGGKETSNINASIVEDTISDREDENIPRKMYGSSTCPFHPE